ncbi:MAG: hypothetical protein ACYCUM_12765 [Solirubrobacteraceae bacterium]
MLRRRRVQIALAALLVLVLVLVLAQLILPRVAARDIRAKVARFGEVRDVSVSAFPAIALLAGDARSVTVRAGTLTVSERALVDLLLEAEGVQRLRVSADAVRLDGLPFGASPIVLEHATLQKDGSTVDAHALLSPESLAHALPRGISAEVLSSAGGVVSLRATGGLFGLKASVDAVLEAVGGRLLLVPGGPLLGGIGSLTLFDQPKLRILSVAASERQGSGNGGWELSVEAKLG